MTDLPDSDNRLIHSLLFQSKGFIMYEQLADYDFNELAIMLSEAFYSDFKDHAETLIQELAWRLENTSI